ncbi:MULTISPECIES: 4-hydroxy-tetrahydrodipicolinate synthase [Lacrimispora]|jgi:4-hydroxy-tetrahydrodipicolinate synthase|uniref:4-hydroxy-tetrahydrodipicolinate synthase n=1 Tax=Lacrimispora TaxID=2719231 RepID=UPI000BE37369|nr:4-hydroxy-tetrahydrodipicolinate synthase [Lacrimispora amygdalina]MDK2965721.1 4-hydroxy-tetrahydrodipicolinate synthase [Lacrimispora sp.]
MNNGIFKGSAAAIVTPMDKQGSLDLTAMERLLKFQLENGTDAILVNGTTGESSTLQEKEKLELLEFVIHYVNHRVPVIMGTGSNSTSCSIQLSRKAQSLGASALLLVTPYYNKTSQHGLVEHFNTIADRVDIPVILYNVPTRTGVNIEPETYLKLSEHPNIRAVKEAGGNISHIAKTAALCGDRLDLYSGNDDQTVPVMSLGGKGVISVLANIMPYEMHTMCELFFKGEIKKSRDMQLELLRIMNAMFMDVNPVPVKAALSILGLCEEKYRLPLVPLKESDKEKLKNIMDLYFPMQTL